MTVTAEGLSLAEEQAFHLSRAAIRLDEARSARADNPGEMTAALQYNLDIWVAIETVVRRADCSLPQEVKGNLLQLARFIYGKTFDAPAGLPDHTIEALVNINLQIAEGLLEGRAQAKAA